jgi:hypothetical protein
MRGAAAVVLIVATLTAAKRGFGFAAALDGQGNLYLAGSSGNYLVRSSGNAGGVVTANAFQPTFKAGICGYQPSDPLHLFPGPSTLQPIPCVHGYIEKISADGTTVLVGTYLGGSGNDVIGAIATDSSGNIYVSGTTTSTDFPVTAGAYQTAPSTNFLSVLSPDGSRLLRSTYLNLGVTGGGSFGSVTAILVDVAGRVIVAGRVLGNGLASTVPMAVTTDNLNGYPNAFVAAFDASLSTLLFANRFGGSLGGVNAAALDPSGAVYATGSTSSTPRNAGTPGSGVPVAPAGGNPFPITPVAYQNAVGDANIFIVKLDIEGTLLFSSVFGGLGDDWPSTLSLDSAGNAYIGGTASTGFPASPSAFWSPNGAFPTQGEGFAAKVSADGSQLLYSTLLGVAGPSYTTISDAGDLFLTGPFAQSSQSYTLLPEVFERCFSAGESQVSPPYGYFLQLSPHGTMARHSAVFPPTVPAPTTLAGILGLEPDGRILVESQTKLFDIFDAIPSHAQRATCWASVDGALAWF